ncbi:MAG: S8 family peptidase [Myxococcota bacterium]
MSTFATSLWKRRAWIAGAGLLAFSTYLATDHAPNDAGIAAEDITPELMAEATRELGPAASTGAWLIDFVEPDDGEGGSEADIESLVASAQSGLGVYFEPAGFYSEGEHLYRLAGPGADVLAADLANDALVEGVEPELIYSLPKDAMSALDGPEPKPPEPTKGARFDPDDPLFHLQWHMEQIRAPEAWTKERGNGAIVAVIDTGVAWKDSKGVKQLPDLVGTTFTSGESFISGLPEGLDDHAHGSHVAGTIAQKTDNGVGVTGIAFESTIMPLKVLSKDGRGSVAGIANAIRYAADNGAHVINMSLGGPLPSKVLAKAIAYAHGKGVTTVCAAGNEKRSRVGYPAANKYSVAVSAVDYERNLTFYSNWGKDIDVAAPGGDTRSDKNGDGHVDGVLQNTIKVGKPLQNDYLWFQGTSMASPHAAGVAALIVASGVTNPDEVERVMKETAVHPDKKEWDQKFGAGIVDAKAAVDKAKASYETERGGLAGLLALLGLAGFGLAGFGFRRRWLGVLGFAGAAAVGSGAFGTPLAYGAAGLFGAYGSPLFMSALLPLGATLLLFGNKRLRGVLTGLNIGYAAMLLHGAVVLPTLISGLPGGAGVDRLWLAANAVLALWLARRASQPRA